ncbi:MAG: DUF4399 domain-containing protein [Reichenbachiella sp.]
MMKYLSLIAVIGLMFSCGPKKETKTVVVEEVMTEVAIADSAYVFFKFPEDGAVVGSPLFIEMGVSGMEVEPAGAVKAGFGHHHILINQTSWPEGQIIPMSDSTLHFGKGQTDTSLELPAGEYTLSLQFANGVHGSYGSEMASSIKVTVE